MTLFESNGLNLTAVAHEKSCESSARHEQWLIANIPKSEPESSMTRSSMNYGNAREV